MEYFSGIILNYCFILFFKGFLSSFYTGFCTYELLILEHDISENNMTASFLCTDYGN